MKKKVIFDTDELYGAVSVLENYLDGALADYENGDVDKDCDMLINDSIKALKLLQDNILGFSPADDYSKRYQEAKKKRTN